jgi:elongation factor 1-gamma
MLTTTFTQHHCSPFGGPYLEVADGFVYDGTSAGRYIAGLRRDSSLFPGSYLEASEVESLVAWALTNVEAPGAALVGAAVNGESADVEGATATLKAGLAALDAYLLTRTYLVGESITFADISVAAGLVYPFQFIVDGAWRKSIGNVTRWFNTCVNQSEFSAVVGEVNLAKENLSAGKAAKKEAAPAAKKEEKPKKEEKKAEKPKADDDDDEPKPEKKAAHPLTLLPPSKMVLDEWKRTYSNFKSQPFT